MSLLKQRRVRSSRFSSKLRVSSRQRREYAASVYSIAVIQLLLGGSFLMAAFRSFQAVRAHADGLPLAAKLVIPIMFAAAGLFSWRACLGNVRSARSLWRKGRSAGRAADNSPGDDKNP